MLRELQARLHAIAPVALQNVAVSLYGWHLRHTRFGGRFSEMLRDATARTFATSGEIERVQRGRWDDVLRPALASVSAYGCRAIDFDELASLPILTKAELRARIDDYRSAIGRRSSLTPVHTSGTTGAGLQFLIPKEALQRQWAYWWRYRQWHGIALDEWSGTFGGRTLVPPEQKTGPFSRVNAGTRSVLFSQYHLTPERARLYLEEIRLRKLRWLHGYPSILALLAQFGIEGGMAGKIPVRWITTGAENLLVPQRRVIEQMFGVRPIQHYGMAEALGNISECPRGALHVDEDYSLIEFIGADDGTGTHRIVGTTLDNWAMPFLRYDIGDRVVIDADALCDCGRPGRVVKSIDGRQEDYVVLSDGSRVGRIDHFFKDAIHVAEAQVVQKRAGRVVVRVVRATGYATADEAALRREIGERCGDRLDVDFDYVQQIPKSASGKLRLVVNEDAAGKLG